MIYPRNQDLSTFQLFWTSKDDGGWGWAWEIEQENKIRRKGEKSKPLKEKGDNE